MFENPRRGRQARNFTTNVPKILDRKSSSEQIFSENCRWLPLGISSLSTGSVSHLEVQSMSKASRRSTRTIFSRFQRQSSRVRVETRFNLPSSRCFRSLRKAHIFENCTCLTTDKQHWPWSDPPLSALERRLWFDRSTHCTFSQMGW